MKKLLFLFTALLFISCSSEDSDDSVVEDNTTNTDGNSSGDNSGETQTFLEKYDGYGFRGEFDGDTEYFYFYDADVFLGFVAQNSYCTVCLSPQEGTNTFDGEDGEMKILTNDSQSLLIEITYEGGDVETLQFVVDSSGNNLTVTFDGDANDTATYVKTSTSFSSLCDNNSSDCNAVDPFIGHWKGIEHQGTVDETEFNYFIHEDGTLEWNAIDVIDENTSTFDVFCTGIYYNNAYITSDYPDFSNTTQSYFIQIYQESCIGNDSGEEYNYFEFPSEGEVGTIIFNQDFTQFSPEGSDMILYKQ